MGWSSACTDMPFFARQKKIVLENSGKIDPERIEDYIAHDGYHALVTAITEMTPQDIVAAIVQQRSARARRRGLSHGPQVEHGGQDRRAGEVRHLQRRRGRSRARSWIARCWKAIPHRVLEGMAIAAYAVGAQKGYIYVRAEYPLAVKHLQNRDQAGRTSGAAGQQHLRHAASASTSISGWARARSCAAKRPR